MAKQYLVFCEWCSFRKIANETPLGIEGLVPIKTAKVPAGIPQLENGKLVYKDAIEVMPKYKCPKCGRGVTAKRLPKPLHEPEPPKKQPKPEDDVPDV